MYPRAGPIDGPLSVSELFSFATSLTPLSASAAIDPLRSLARRGAGLNSYTDKASPYHRSLQEGKMRSRNVQYRSPGADYGHRRCHRSW